MNKNLISKLIVYLGVFLLISCQKEFELKNLKYEPKIVVNSIFSVGNNIKIYLYSTLPVDSDFNLPQYMLTDSLIVSKYPKISSAEINLYENGNFIEKVEELDSGYYKSKITAKEGKKYEIKIKADGYPDVFAFDTVPLSVKFSFISFVDTINYYSYFQIRLKNDRNRYFRTYLKISDTSNTYYQDIQFTQNIKYIWQAESKLLNSNDFQTDSLVLGLKNAPFTIKKIYIYFGSVSYNYYKYYETISLQPLGDDQIFAQPIAVFSNIQNGYGIFAAYNDGQPAILNTYK